MFFQINAQKLFPFVFKLLKIQLQFLSGSCLSIETGYLRCFPVYFPPPKPYGEIDKKALFPNFLFFFTFACRRKKITFFFVRNLTKTCAKH
jgi:hypothetical protein